MSTKKIRTHTFKLNNNILLSKSGKKKQKTNIFKTNFKMFINNEKNS